MGHYVFVENLHYTILAALVIFASFRYLRFYNEKKLKKWDEKNKKLDSQIQDIKMQLLT